MKANINWNQFGNIIGLAMATSMGAAWGWTGAVAGFCGGVFLMFYVDAINKNTKDKK